MIISLRMANQNPKHFINEMMNYRKTQTTHPKHIHAEEKKENKREII